MRNQFHLNKRFLQVFILSALLWGISSAFAASADEDSEGSGGSPNQYLEPELVKGSALESLIKAKVRDVLLSRGYSESHFESTVSVKVTKSNPQPVKSDSKKKPLVAAENANKQVPPMFLESARAFDTDRVIGSLYKDGEDPAAAVANQYVASQVAIYVGLKTTMSPEKLATIETALKTQLQPLIGQAALDLKVELVSHADSSQLIELLYKFQNLAICFLMGFLTLCGLLLWKLLTGSGSRNQLKLDMNQRKKEESEISKKGSSEDKDSDSKPIHFAPNRPGPTPVISPQKQIQGLKKKIASLAQRNTNGFSAQLEQWVRLGEPASKIALTLESVSDEGALPPRFAVEHDSLAELKQAKEAILRMEPSEVVENLEQIYWELLASECFGEQSVETPLKGLEKFDDSILAAVLLGEEPGVQNAILSSIESRRASKVLTRLKPEIRKKLLEQLSDSDIAQVNPDQSLFNQLKSKAEETQKSGPATLDGSNSLQKSFLSILDTMDFETQFAIGLSIVAMSEEKRGNLLSEFFHISLLPLFNDEALQNIFTDRTPEWIVGVTSQFEGLVERVRPLLPPIQQRMLEGTKQTMAKKSILDELETLHTQMSEKLASGSLSIDQLYSKGGQDEPQAMAA